MVAALRVPSSGRTVIATACGFDGSVLGTQPRR